MGKQSDLTGKTCVLTGGTSDLGCGIFEACVRANASRIFLLYRSREKADTLMAKVAGAQAVTTLVKCELSLMQDVARAADEIAAAAGNSIDVVFLNAALLSGSSLHRTSEGLEETLAEQLRKAGVAVRFELLTIKYEKPATGHKYTPDFELPNGIIIESKGRFVTADRQKHILVKAQHPDLDIRFVFSRSASRISKTSKTTYAAWCIKHGFLYADKTIPAAWLTERKM